MLADDALVELFLHAHQLLGLGLGELEDRDARPHRDDVGDLRLVDRAADRLRDDLDRLVLADDALVELFLHAHQLLGLGLGELEDRDARPHRDDVGDLRLVDEVDGLVGQLAVGDVAIGQLGGCFQRLVGDLDLVVLLVAVAQALEELHRLLGGRLVHADLLEAPLQGGVALQVLAVLVERRGADGLQLAAGQGRLEDRRGVDRALCGARTDEVVELVDEQDDGASSVMLTLWCAS